MLYADSASTEHFYAPHSYKLCVAEKEARPQQCADHHADFNSDLRNAEQRLSFALDTIILSHGEHVIPFAPGKFDLGDESRRHV
jgi:hypothetical protein